MKYFFVDNSKTKEVKLESSIQNIITQCKKGNSEYQELLYKRIYIKQFGVTKRYTGNNDEAQDMFNDAMLKIFSSLNKYDSSKDFFAWTYKIILNSSIDYLRKTIKYNKRLFDIKLNIESKHDYNYGLNELEADDIFKVIQSLPKDERTIFSLYEIDGLKHREISKKLGISISHSKWLLSKSKQSLKSILKKNDIKVKIK